MNESLRLGGLADSDTTNSNTNARSPGTLFVVASPIGNLEDITLRAIRVLETADLVLAEDTRRTRQLLNHLSIQGKPLQCLDAHASESDYKRCLTHLAQGKNLALVTDAGTPAVSDPGTELVRQCHAANVRVVPLPGASAVTAAVAASGLVHLGFLFLGFTPRKGEKRRSTLQRIRDTKEAVVLFEAPPRMAALLQDLAELMPARRACVCREITKKFEEVAVHPLSVWVSTDREWRGELTVVIGADESAGDTKSDEAEIDELILGELELGARPKEIATQLAARTGKSRRDIYQRALDLKG